MEKSLNNNSRRNFIKVSGMLSTGLLIPTTAMANEYSLPVNDNIHEFGQREGYTEQMSILISMMDWMRATVLRSVNGLSVNELDFLLDENANSIGAMLLHLAATERYYQIHTFDGRDWGDFDKKDTDIWDVAMGLGDKAREEIKGNPLSFYTDKLSEVRAFSKKQLKERNDSWLMEKTNFFASQPTNNYCKWFHVVEHESNHNGQIKYIKSRIT
ncbi:MAG: DinB family protein [Muriicola sp.]|nr:DinB family protein [Muriicola sp.]